MNIKLGGFGQTNNRNKTFSTQQEFIGIKIPSLIYANKSGRLIPDSVKNFIDTNSKEQTTIEILVESLRTMSSLWINTKPNEGQVERVYNDSNPLIGNSIYKVYKKAINEMLDRIYTDNLEIINFDAFLFNVNKKISNRSTQTLINKQNAKSFFSEAFFNIQFYHFFLTNNKKFCLIFTLPFEQVYMHKVQVPNPRGRSNRERNIGVNIKNHNAKIRFINEIRAFVYEYNEQNNLSTRLLELEVDRDNIYINNQTNNKTNNSFFSDLKRIGINENTNNKIFSENENLQNSELNKTFAALNPAACNGFIRLYSYIAIAKFIKNTRNFQQISADEKKKYSFVLSMFILNKILYAIYFNDESKLEDNNLLVTEPIVDIITTFNSSLTTAEGRTPLDRFYSVLYSKRSQNSIFNILEKNRSQKVVSIFHDSFRNNLGLTGMLTNMFSTDKKYSSVLEEMKLIYRLATHVEELNSPVVTQNQTPGAFDINLNEYFKELVV